MPRKKEDIVSSDKLPPQDIEAEQSVLGGILIDPKAITNAIDILEPDDFYKREHRLIFEAMQELFRERQAIDLVMLSARLKEKKQLADIGGMSYLTELVERVPTSSHVAHYANVVHKKRVLRDLISASYEISALGWEENRNLDELLDEAEQKLFRVSQKTGIPTLVHIKQDLKAAWDRIEQIHVGAGRLRGIPTGFQPLDDLLAGLQKSNLVVLAARPSFGKTALALDIARHAALREGAAVAVFSLEMSRAEVVDRLIAAEAGISLWNLRTGRLAKDNFELINDALDRLSRAHIFIDDTPSQTVLQIRALARRMQAEHPLGLLIVDYLQLIRPSREIDNVVQQVTEISRGLKGLARELDIPVLAVSQLSRAVEARPDKRPQLSDLRDSGSIEQDADVVLFIHHPNRGKTAGPEENICEIIVSKHRNGPIGKRNLYFNKECVSFVALSDRELELDNLNEAQTPITEEEALEAL
jgi:replicative DNA helicase